MGTRTAQILAAEIGLDMARFPSAAHLASWAGLCPGNNESAGTRKSGTTLYGRLLRRRGKKRALVAVGHTILVIA